MTPYNFLPALFRFYCWNKQYKNERCSVRDICALPKIPTISFYICKGARVKNVWMSDKNWELSSLSHSLTLSLSHPLTQSLSTCWTTFVFMAMLKSHILALSYSHTLSFSHSITLDMLNNFCFHGYASFSFYFFLYSFCFCGRRQSERARPAVA